MTIRLLNKNDIPELSEIHKKYHEKDFELPDFGDGKFIGAYAVVDDYGKIISVLGIKTILEAIALTDMSRSVNERTEALTKLLQAGIFVSDRYGFDQLHCFPLTSKAWERHLRKIGFRECKGTALYLNLF